MNVTSPVSNRLTVTGLLLLTFATGMIDAVSVLVLGHVFVANMTGNVVFLGFWFAQQNVVDMTAAVVAFVSFVSGAVIGGRFARHLEHDIRRWLTVTLAVEVRSAGGVVDTRGHGCARLPRRHEADPDRGSGGHVRHPERDGATVRHPGAEHDGPDVDHRRNRIRQQAGRRHRRAGEAALLRSC